MAWEYLYGFDCSDIYKDRFAKQKSMKRYVKNCASVSLWILFTLHWLRHTKVRLKCWAYKSITHCFAYAVAAKCSELIFEMIMETWDLFWIPIIYRIRGAVL